MSMFFIEKSDDESGDRPMGTPGDLPTNWARWGLDDELGALNFITDDVRARAVEQATTGRTVSLAMPLTPVPLAGAPMPMGSSTMPAPVLQMMTFTGSPAAAFTDVLMFNTHNVAMTHIDALAHIPVEGKVYPGVAASEAIAHGTVRQGSSTAFAAGISTRGVLLDLAPGNRLPAEHRVTGGDLDAAEQRAEVRVESGDALFVRAGWTVHTDFEDGLPSMTLGAVRWMADREISLFGGDIGDRPPTGPGQPMPLHHVALARLGIPLIDGADVSTLAATSAELGRWTFLFVLGPIPVRGATGVPVNPLAIF